MTPHRHRPILFVLLSISLTIGANVGATVKGAREKSSEDKISESSITKSNYTGEVSPSDGHRREVGDIGEGKAAAAATAVAAEVAGDSINEEEEDDEAEYEDEVEVADEYADELRAAAESHEAMSRRDENEGKNRSATGEVEPRKLVEQKLREETAKKDFNSRETSVETGVGSDESETSNETILENKDAEDEEVAELRRYKTQDLNFRPSEGNEKESAKRKRVPTVKKELSTQKEIVKTSNASVRVEKRFSTKEMLDELNEQLKHSMVGNTEKPCLDAPKSIEDETSGEVGDVDEGLETVVGEEDYFAADKLADSKGGDLDLEDLEEPIRKLDKRQETVLRDLEAYLRAEYAAEQEQQQKLQELGAQEGALAESLLELLVKLAENPRRWERVHRLLKDVEGGLELSREALEARKRAFNLTSSVTATTTTSPVSTGGKKLRKKPKKKKKKKKQRHHRFSTPSTTLPTTLPLLTTTEVPWLTTPMQWRLVAERLFGPPWPQDLQDDSSVAKVRFTVPSSSRTTSNSREFGEQLGERKQLEEHKALNDERQALMLESSREYTQPRHLHYGKVNTHQGVSGHRDPSASASSFRTANRDSSRVRDYDPPERGLYGQFYPASRGRVQDQEYPPVVESYAQNHEYRPPGREYAASKSWRDAQYNYGRPKWGWWQSENEGKAWPEFEETKRLWHTRERDYWPRGKGEAEGSPSKAWVPHRSDAWERVRDPDPWSKSSWGLEGAKSSPPWETVGSRGATEEKTKDVSGAGTSPKITMKTWNSLTSDPATWPFKFTDTKPWPKDANGKSYNPNAALVRKLGLDAEEIKHPDGFKSPDLNAGKTTAKSINDVRKYKSVTKAQAKEEKSAFEEQTGPKKSSTLEGDEEPGRANPWRNDADTNPKIWPPKAAMSPKIQSVGAWVMPADQSTWKPYNLKTVDSYGSGGNADRWNVQMNTNPRTWAPKIGEEQWNKFAKPLNGVTWPKWKQFAYHKVTATPILSPGPGSGIEGQRARNNAYIAVSAVSPKYNGNQWRKNDIEETPVVQSSSSNLQDPEHPVNQLRGGVQPAIYTWKKDGSSVGDQQQNVKKNSTDPLEEQLETLRRGSSWSHDENQQKIKEQLNIISAVSSEALTASRSASGSTRNSSSNKLEEVRAAAAPAVAAPPPPATSNVKEGYNPEANINEEKKSGRS